MNYALLAALKESASTRRALAISSCLQAALAERSDGSERSEAKQKKLPLQSPISYDVRSCCTACRFIWRLRAARFKFSIFKLRVLASKFKNLRLICDFGDAKF